MRKGLSMSARLMIYPDARKIRASFQGIYHSDPTSSRCISAT